jgi:hypothetical protein
MMIIPLWDPVAAAAEIERTAALGAKSIAFSENPTKLGLPSIHTDYWDPVLRGADEAGFVLSMHVGSSSNLIRTSPDMPTLAFMAYSAAANQAGTLLDWLFSGYFERFPGLKIALSEGSIGWMPYFLERAEQVIDKQRFWASRFDIDMNASHERGEEKGEAKFNLDTDIRRLFKDHVFGTFIEDHAGRPGHAPAGAGLTHEGLGRPGSLPGPRAVLADLPRRFRPRRRGPRVGRDRRGAGRSRREGPGGRAELP